MFPDLQSLPASLDLFSTMPYFCWTGNCLLFSSFYSQKTLISCLFHLKRWCCQCVVVFLMFWAVQHFLNICWYRLFSFCFVSGSVIHSFIFSSRRSTGHCSLLCVHEDVALNAIFGYLWYTGSVFYFVSL